MRWGACSAALAACLAFSSVVAAPNADARTRKELNVCWVNGAPGEWLDLEVVVDGPSFKTASLDHGDCVAWDVQPGQYKLTVEDVEEFRAAMRAACAKPRTPSLRISVKRQQEEYRTGGRELRNGGLVTHVRKDRRTTVLIELRCARPTP